MFGFHTPTNTEEGRVKSTFQKKLPALAKNSSILDLGCSYGVTTIEISQIYTHSSIIGIDINEEAIKRANKENSVSNITYVHGNGYVSFQASSFDLIFAMNNLYYEFRHPKDNDPKVLTQRCLDMLKNNGYLLISQKNYDFLIIQKREERYFLIEENDHDLDFDIGNIWDYINSLNK